MLYLISQFFFNLVHISNFTDICLESWLSNLQRPKILVYNPILTLSENDILLKLNLKPLKTNEEGPCLYKNFLVWICLNHLKKIWMLTMLSISWSHHNWPTTKNCLILLPTLLSTGADSSAEKPPRCQSRSLMDNVQLEQDKSFLSDLQLYIQNHRANHEFWCLRGRPICITHLMLQLSKAIGIDFKIRTFELPEKVEIIIFNAVERILTTRGLFSEP